MGAVASMSDDDAQYEVNTGDAGSAATVSVEAGQIRKGGYIMIKGKPCKVRDVSVSKTGKHGHPSASSPPWTSSPVTPARSSAPPPTASTSLLSQEGLDDPGPPGRDLCSPHGR